MIRRKVQLIFFFSVSWLTPFAQQDPQFSQYFFNRLFYNPAYAGSENGINSTCIFRNQWKGFTGNPVTGVVSIDAPINKINSGIGGIFAYDQLGNEKTLIGKTSYNYKIKFLQGIFSLGVDAGIINKEFKWSTWIANDPNDPKIPSSDINTTAFDISAGTYFRTDKFFAGLSSTHLTQPRLKGGNFSYIVVRHYYFTSGNNFSVSEKISLQPSVLIKSDAASTQIDLNATISHKYFLIGTGYRIRDAVVLLAGLKLKGFTISYSYDITTSLLKKYSSGSHELVLRYIRSMKNQSHPNKVGTVETH